MSTMAKMQQFLGDSKPFTAVTDWIDRLCGPKYGEEELEGIPELVQAINLQQTGPTEASRAIRKKLKYGNLHAQKRALTILRSLVENCNSRFQRTFADAMLVERIKIMSQDELVDASVRRKLMRVLAGWQKQFAGDPAMRQVAGLYVACGGGRKSEQQLKSEAAEKYRLQREREERERQIRADHKAAKRLQEEEQRKAAKNKGKKGSRPPFDFQKEKPAILGTVAATQHYATALVNALQHVNRERESVTVNARVQDYLAKVKNERKKIVRYIQLVRDEEFLGSLISANDQIILALGLYDKLAKPADVDSDEEDNEPLAAIAGTGEGKQARIDAEDAEIEAVRKRLLQARLMDGPDGELEKLQVRQRVGIQRHNSRYGAGAGGSSGGGGGGAMADLMDLNFDDDADRDDLPPSIQPKRLSSAASASAASGSIAPSSSSRGGTAGQGAGLSDYSDLDSDDDYDEEDEDAAEVARAGTSSSAGGSLRYGTHLAPGKGRAGGYGGEEDDFDDSASFASHRPQIGPQYSGSIQVEGEGDDGDFDPFADPDDHAGPPTPGSEGGSSSFAPYTRRHEGPRQAFAAV